VRSAPVYVGQKFGIDISLGRRFARATVLQRTVTARFSTFDGPCGPRFRPEFVFPDVSRLVSTGPVTSRSFEGSDIFDRKNRKAIALRFFAPNFDTSQIVPISRRTTGLDR
jgi:hypothetical protein